VAGVGDEVKHHWGKTGQRENLKYRISAACPPTYLKLSCETFMSIGVILCTTKVQNLEILLSKIFVKSKKLKVFIWLRLWYVVSNV